MGTSKSSSRRSAAGGMLRRVGLLTAGGDAAGLNAVIRGAVIRLAAGKAEAVGILEGWKGLAEASARSLTVADVADIAAEAGTILGTSRFNPCRYAGRDLPRLRAGLARLELDALVAVGGAEAMGVAARLCAEGVRVVGVPKAAGNDLPGTDLSVGLLSAVESAARAMDALAATARSERRVLVVECMGRHAGWIAGLAGLAAGADWTILPEEGADLAECCRRLAESHRAGRRGQLVAVAEGARFAGAQVPRPPGPDEFGRERLGGVGELVARLIAKETGLETRHVALGALQRAGSPCAADRLLGTMLGVHAAELALEGRSGRMAALRDGRVTDVPLDEAAGHKPLAVELLDLIRLFRR